jgi:AAA15 family ATPase/GTPase
MLIEYGLRNFLSFKDGVTVSFRLDANAPDSVSQGRNFATLMCVKGANGSGKTHLLKGLAFIADFAVRSFAREPEDEILVDPFYGDTGPSEFFVEFGVGTNSYRYEIALSRKGVQYEALYRTQVKRVKLFERSGDVLKNCTTAYAALKTMKLRGNASVVSTARQYEVKGLEPVIKFFSNIVSNVGYEGHRERTFLHIDSVSKMCYKNPEALNFAVDFIRTCDIGISNIKIEEQDIPGEEAKRYTPYFFHIVDNVEIPIRPSTESNGTKQLFRSLFAYQLVLATGGVLVLDEFDVYLHPHILPKLVAFFAEPEKNPKGAQLLFTTHSLEIIDYSGRYRTYLVNKDENVSFAFRLDEIPGDILRNDRSIIPAYREGRIRGVPRL